MSEQLTYFLEQNPSVAKTILENPFWRSAPARRRESTGSDEKKDGAGKYGAAWQAGGLLRQGSEKLRDLHRRGRFRRRLREKGEKPRDAGDPSLRGKILNVEKARLDKIFSNNEIKAMITRRNGIHDD